MDLTERGPVEATTCVTLVIVNMKKDCTEAPKFFILIIALHLSHVTHSTSGGSRSGGTTVGWDDGRV